jgi:hypothetical protein|tara:strand:- start:9 stop:491 length:483 start_codon:yes stop_codon:yes gene_type:complete
MAFTPATGDTNISKPRASKALRPSPGISPLTGRSATSRRLPLNRSLLKFGSTNRPQPARTAGKPVVAPPKNINIGGPQAYNNPIADAIAGIGKKLGSAIAKQQAPLSTGVPGMTTSDIPANTNFFSPVTDAIGFTSPPVSSDFNASIAMMKHGGFIRRRS